MNLVWFRNDLRVNDNPALSAAMDANNQVVAVYCLCQKQWQSHDMGANQQGLIVEAIKNLQKALEAINVRLIILSPETFDNVPEALEKLCSHLEVTDLFFNMEYPTNERKRDKNVVQKLESKISVHRKIGQSLVAPWKIVTADETGYKVFSAYARKVLQALEKEPPIATGKPEKKPSSNLDIAAFKTIENVITQLPTIKITAKQLPDISEKKVLKQLSDFCNETIGAYKDKRDYPAIAGTSNLSSALAVGTLSVARCYLEAFESSQSQKSTWINELIWRDFYRAVMWHYPHVCRGKAFLDVDQNIEWSYDKQRFAAWKSGQTGVPIVDAAMNQLNQTGWMHNRLRMIVASYLTKNLFIDWRWGERYFANQLFDFDFASNNGGWQWSASVGTDAAPYFRVFNPASQQKKFDPDAEFIQRWIPKLKSFSSAEIHKFESRPLKDYPACQVDLSESRKQAIAHFKAAKS